MKKTNLILAATLFLSYSAFSQHITIKPGIGFNVSDFSKTSDGNAKGKVGYQVGGSVAFGKKAYIEPGLFFTGKSTEFTYSNTTNPQIDAKLTGFRIPVAVGFNALGNEKTPVSMRIFGGGSVFFITSTGDDINKDSVNKTNWGLFAGAGLDFWKLFVDMSYEWSLTNIQKDVSAIDVGKTRTFYFTAGLRINL